MEQLVGALGNSEVSLRPETLIYYGAFAVLVTVFVNWAMATLLVVLRPFTCAAILLTFVRPDLVQKLLQEECLRHLSDKTKTLFSGFFNLLLKLGEQFRSKLN